MNLAARLQQRPLLQQLVQTGKRNVPWSVGVRNTAAIVLPLVLGVWADRLMVGLGITIGALVTMFADQPGPYRLRLRRMLLAAAAAGLAAFAGTVLGEWRPALLVATALWGFAAALLVAIDPHATRAGLISLILLVITGADPHPVPQAVPIAVLVFLGGMLQMLVAIAAWPLQRYRPERLVLAQAFRGLAAHARADIPYGTSVALPPSLNDLHTALYGTGRARGRAVEAFRILVELTERIRIELFALAQQQSQCAASPLRATLAATRSAAGQVLITIATALEQAAAPRAQAALAAWTAAGSASAGLPAATVAALGGQLRAAVRNADAASSHGEIRARNAEFRLPRVLRPGNPIATLRANLHLRSPACRHALRCSASVVVAMALAHVLPLSRGYWLPMTAVIVLKPDFGTTWRYGLLRVAGTLGGLLLTTAVLHFLGGTENVWAALALLAALCFAYRELAAVHYGIAVVCLTGLVVILLSFYGIPAETAVHARALDTVLGSALALLAYIAWPTWERGREPAALAGMLDAYREYLDAVLRGDARTRRETRVAARAARSQAEASLDRLRNEPVGHANLPRAQALTAHANRLIRAAMALEATREDTGAAPQRQREIDAFAQACDQALREAAAALRHARTPETHWQLRARQRTLAASLATPSDAFDRALGDATDRIADAIDTLLHVLVPHPAGTENLRPASARSESHSTG